MNLLLLLYKEKSREALAVLRGVIMLLQKGDGNNSPSAKVFLPGVTSL
jgi:hypothetical protein